MSEALYSNAYNSVNRENFVAAYSYSDSLPRMTIGERIEERMIALDISQTELARRVGVSQPTIRALMKGEAQGSKHLHRIAAELETSPAYLAGETDDMAPVTFAPSALEALADKLDLEMIPEIEIKYGMGGGRVLEGFEQRGIVPFQRAWLRGMMRGRFSDLFVARGDGDSMQPTIQNDDFVLIDTSWRTLDGGDQVWAVTYGDLGYIKRVRSLPGGRYELMSDNKAVPSIICDDGEMDIIGRVVWIGRRMAQR